MPISAFFVRLIVLCLMFALIGGCASMERADPVTVASEPPTVEVGAIPIFKSGGAVASIDDVVAAMAQADVVLIGESHGHPDGLALAADLWSRTLALTARPALALEFFERDEQAHLDDFLTGVTTDEQFRKNARRTAGNYPDGHRIMVEQAKGAGAPVAASNAPRRYVRLARLEGFSRLAGLTPEQRRLFVIPKTLPTGRYRDEFFSMMGAMPTNTSNADGASHSGDGDRVERQKTLMGFYRSQSMWDATMADSIARALAEGRRPVVQVVGRFHSDFEGGLTQFLRVLAPEARIVTISMAPETRDTLASEDAGRADFVVYVGPMPEKPKEAESPAPAPSASNGSVP